MKPVNPTLAVLRTIAAVLLSILLVVILVVLPLHQTVTGITRPKQLASMVGDVVRQTDIAAFIDTTGELQLGEHTLDAATSQKLLQSPVARNILGDCAEQVILVATADDADEALLEDKVSSILTARMEEMTALVKEHVPQAAEKSVEDIQIKLTDNLPQLSQAVLNELPSTQELQQLTSGIINKTDTPPATQDPVDPDSTAPDDTSVDDTMAVDSSLATVRRLLSPAATWTLWGVTVVLAAMVVLCRLRYLNGLVWLGADALVAGGLLLTACLLLGGEVLESLLSGEGSTQALFSSAVQVIVDRIQTGAILLLVAGVLLLAGGIVYKVLLTKKEAALQAAANE